MRAMQPVSITRKGDDFVLICENADGKHEYVFNFEPMSELSLLKLDSKFLKENHQDPGTHMVQDAIGKFKRAIIAASETDDDMRIPQSITANGGSKYVVGFKTTDGVEEGEFTADDNCPLVRGLDNEKVVKELGPVEGNLTLAIQNLHNARRLKDDTKDNRVQERT